MENTARNLVITLALPHLSREEDRVDFLAEQAFLGALCLHGPTVARKSIRRMAKLLRDPAFIEGVAEGLSNTSDPLLFVADLLRKTAAESQRDAEPPADAPPPAPPQPSIRTPDEYDRRFTGAVNIRATPMVGGTLHVTQKHILFTGVPFTIIPERIARKIVDGRPRLSGPIIRMLAVIPTQEGHDLTLDAEIPAGFTPAQSLVLTPENIIALPEDVLNTEFVLADRNDIDLAFDREPETGYLTATVSATYRPASAPGKQDVAMPSEVSTDSVDLVPPDAVRFPGAPMPADAADAAATDAPPTYSVVLTLNCVTPRDGLVRAIRDCVVERGDGTGLPFDEAHAYAKTLVQNFRQGEPVIVAKSASRESADIMCRAIIRTGARASVIPSVVPAGESAADGAAWHSLMLVDRGVSPYISLAYAIAKVTLPASLAFRGGATEEAALRRAVDLVDNFTAPVEIARYESQATAERMRASLVERVGERGARFAVVLSAPPEPRPVATEATAPSPQPAREETAAPAERAVPKRRAKKPRHSR